MEKIFEKTYNWEELCDLERDVSEAIEWNEEIPNGEFPGTIKVTIEYYRDDEPNKAADSCNECGGELETLNSREGDPEGIRHDRQCTVCGQKWGVSKAMKFKIP